MDIMVDNPVVTYAAPASVRAAVQLLAASDDAKVVAGCQSLGVFLRQRLIEPALLVGLKGIPELSEIVELPDGGLRMPRFVPVHHPVGQRQRHYHRQWRLEQPVLHHGLG